jgi:hypothetical protein
MLAACYYKKVTAMTATTSKMGLLPYICHNFDALWRRSLKTEQCLEERVG